MSRSKLNVVDVTSNGSLMFIYHAYAICVVVLLNVRCFIRHAVLGIPTLATRPLDIDGLCLSNSHL